MNQLVSILMCAYNEPIDYVRLSLESVLNQTYSFLEINLVIDNPENRELIELVSEYAKNDNRLHVYINEQNIGLARSLNVAIQHSTGYYLARMDADDICFSERISKQVEYLENNPNCDMVCANRINIDSNGNEITTNALVPLNDEALQRSLSFISIITHPTVLMKRDIVIDVGCYNNYPCGQDYDLWLRLKRKGTIIHFMEEPLLYYRIHGSNTTSSKKLKQWLCASFARKCDKEKVSFSREKLDEFIATKTRNGRLLKWYDQLQRAKSSGSVFLALPSFICSSDCRQIVLYSIKYKKYVKVVATHK